MVNNRFVGVLEIQINIRFRWEDGVGVAMTRSVSVVQDLGAEVGGSRLMEPCGPVIAE